MKIMFAQEHEGVSAPDCIVNLSEPTSISWWSWTRASSFLHIHAFPVQQPKCRSELCEIKEIQFW